MSARVRRIAAGLALVSLLAGCTDVPPESSSEALDVRTPSVRATPSARPQLPRGGRTLFPQHRLVAFVGTPGAPALGPLDSDLDNRLPRLDRLARAYAAGRTPLPVMELIAVVAQSRPGPDGRYRLRIDDAEISRYLALARKYRMLLVLDIQPGRADVLAETRRLERWLAQPDVGLAIDPEWQVGPEQVPGRVFGRVTGRELDAVAAYLAGVVRRHDLPEKLLVFHQLTKRIVVRESELRRHPGVAVVKSVDGIGSRAAKTSTYDQLTPTLAPGVRAGFKLFYTEDSRHGRLMTPREVLALRPRPELVTYE